MRGRNRPSERVGTTATVPLSLIVCYFRHGRFSTSDGRVVYWSGPRGNPSGRTGHHEKRGVRSGGWYRCRGGSRCGEWTRRYSLDDGGFDRRGISRCVFEGNHSPDSRKRLASTRSSWRSQRGVWSSPVGGRGPWPLPGTSPNVYLPSSHDPSKRDLLRYDHPGLGRTHLPCGLRRTRAPWLRLLHPRSRPVYGSGTRYGIRVPRDSSETPVRP